MNKNENWANDSYMRHYREVADRMFGSAKRGADACVRVDLPGLKDVLAFPVGGLTVIVGYPGAGKSILCDNLVANAEVPVIYFPLQSTSLESAHMRLCAVDAGIDYGGAVVRRRSMADRIALAEASERLLGCGVLLVCLDEVTPSLFNSSLVDIIGESTACSGSIDEEASERLIVLDNVDMLAADGLPLWQRIQFLKDVIKGTRAALVVVVAGDCDELWAQLANADEVYSIAHLPVVVPAPAASSLKKGKPERSKKAIINNEKTSRFDGHPRKAEIEIDLPVRTIHGVGK